MAPHNRFTTSNLHVACYLLSINAGRFRGIQWPDDRNAEFVFMPPPEGDPTMEFFDGGIAPARALFDNLRLLRNMMRETKPTGAAA